MRVLITGAGGMVGSHLAESLCLRGDDVTGTWHKNRKNIDEITLPIRFVQCDLRYGHGLDGLIMDLLPQQIYHLAAQSYPTVSWDSPYETIDVNMNGTVAVFEAVLKARKYVDSGYDPMVVVACSSAEYGQTMDEAGGQPVREDAPLKPLHPYAVSKVGQDLLAYQYFMNHHIRCIRARIFNTTGTRKVRDALSEFIERALAAERDGSDTIRAGSLDTRRAILDQRDLISALTLLAQRGTAGEAYNISSERVYQMRELLDGIGREMGRSFVYRQDPALLRPTDERTICGDVSRLKKDTGWTQWIPIEQTIRDMIAYRRQRMKADFTRPV